MVIDDKQFAGHPGSSSRLSNMETKLFVVTPGQALTPGRFMFYVTTFLTPNSSLQDIINYFQVKN